MLHLGFQLADTLVLCTTAMRLHGLERGLYTQNTLPERVGKCFCRGSPLVSYARPALSIASSAVNSSTYLLVKPQYEHKTIEHQ